MKPDYELLSTLFGERGFAGSDRKERYSSTKHEEITSSTISIFGEIVCLHCHKKALPVQKTIRTPMGTDYKDAGYRCTCKDAINEMAKRIAINEVDLPNIKMPTLTIKNEALTKLVASKKCRDISQLTSKRNGKIEEGSVKGNFFNHENTRVIKDNYYDFLPLHSFGRMIVFYMQEAVKEYETRAKENVASVNSTIDSLK